MLGCKKHTDTGYAPLPQFVHAQCSKDLPECNKLATDTRVRSRVFSKCCAPTITYAMAIIYNFYSSSVKFE